MMHMAQLLAKYSFIPINEVCSLGSAVGTQKKYATGFSCTVNSHPFLYRTVVGVFQVERLRALQRCALVLEVMMKIKKNLNDQLLIVNLKPKRNQIEDTSN